MRLTKKPKPLAVCNVCHALTDQHESINQRCNNTVSGRRCSGTYHSNLTAVFDECGSCQATGKVGSQTCGECQGFGWRFYA